MKAIFIQRDCLLRASGYDPEDVSGEIELSEDTLEGLRELADTGLYLMLVGRDTLQGSDEEGEKPRKGVMRTLAGMIAAAEDKTELDAMLVCTHPAETECACWGPQPGYLHEADAAFETRLNESYFVSDSLLDVDMACAGGCRPVFVLAGRSIAEVFGDKPEHKDVPIAVDLKMAARYVRQEEEIARQLGKPRTESAPSLDTGYFEAASLLPSVVPLSARAETLARTLRRPKLQPGEVARWLLYFVVGGLGVSLGIAYILTHLYRQKHFPEWVWYATLQFIPRETRGIIFIAVGLGILSVALWGVYRGITNGQAAKRSQERR